VALYKQTSFAGITAAGTVPDSHRIPFRRGNYRRLIAISGCKDTTFFITNLQITVFFFTFHRNTKNFKRNAKTK
jgi:hypothetical protein